MKTLVPYHQEFALSGLGINKEDNVAPVEELYVDRCPRCGCYETNAVYDIDNWAIVCSNCGAFRSKSIFF